MLFLYGTDLKQLRKILAALRPLLYNEKALRSKCQKIITLEALAKLFPVLRTITTHI